ncbi:MAG: FHA domain-containing protein [Gemmataceae bacterium]
MSQTSPTSAGLDITWVQGQSPRLLLWVDGIGGYLVCLGSRVTLGQVNPETTPDISLLADISRHHATIERDAEAYTLSAIRKVSVNGQTVERCLLRDGDRLTLGVSCQLVFGQPARLSASARVNVVSGHRLAQPVEGVLLMADTLVLGAGPQSHVSIEELEKPVVLFRHDKGIGVRHEGRLKVDGEVAQERALIHPGQRVSAGGVTFTFEAFSPGAGWHAFAGPGKGR